MFLYTYPYSLTGAKQKLKMQSDKQPLVFWLHLPEFKAI